MNYRVENNDNSSGEIQTMYISFLLLRNKSSQI